MKYVSPFEKAAVPQKIPKKVTANHNAIDTVDTCFECQKPMQRLEANGVDCFVCLDHRVCLPCPND